MRPSVLRAAIVLALAGAFGALWCVAAEPFVHGDPLLGFEIIAGAMLVLWSLAVSSNLLRAHLLRRELLARSERRIVSGIEVNVVAGAANTALVLGVFRPRIFVGDDYEDHHRSIWAPVRAAAIEAWLPIVGRFGAAKRALIERLGDLELMADRHALARGCSRAALASALIKAQPSAAGLSAVSYDADRRIDALLNQAGDRKLGQRLPYEWVPVAALLLIALSCHTWAG